MKRDLKTSEKEKIRSESDAAELEEEKTVKDELSSHLSSSYLSSSA